MTEAAPAEEQIVKQEQPVAPAPVAEPAPVPDEVEITDAEQEAAPQTEPETKPFDPKTDKVEFNTPEQQEKFNYMYKQTKMSDARNQMLTELLQTQQKQLDELQSRFSKTDSAEAERILMNSIRAAKESGDIDAELKATTELIDFKADKKVNALQKQSPQQPLQQESQDTKYVTSLMQETDHSGQPVRPWLYEGHPEFEGAINSLQDIAFKYIGDPQALQKSMTDLDNLMREKMTPKKPVIQPQVRAPNPMHSGNLTNSPPKPTIKMSRAELDIARKLGVDPKRYAATRDAQKGKK